MPVETKIQNRRDTAANWTSTNPTLASGELGVETDTNLTKIGNGSTAWTSLPYVTPRQRFTPKTNKYFRTPANQTGGSSFTANLMTLTPIEFGAPVTVTRIQTYVNIMTVSGIVRLGIYNSDTDGMPGDLLLDAGTITASTTGVTYAITINQNLNAGRYWLAGVQQSGTFTINGITATAMFSQGFQYDNVSGNTNPIFPTIASVTGTLPASASTYTLNSVGTAIQLQLGTI